jgi:cytochrome c-type biogenesis protein CcmF
LLALLLLMGMGPLLAWRRASPAALRRNFLAPVAFGLASGLVLTALGMRVVWALVAFSAAGFVAATIAQEFWRGTHARMRVGEAAPAALLGLVRRNRRRYGGYVVHLAMVLIALGIIASTFFQQDHGLRLGRGESAQVGRYTLTNRGLFQDTQAHVQETYALVVVQVNGQTLAELQPSKRVFVNWEQQPTSGIAIRTTWPWLEDLYLVLVSANTDGSASLQVFVNPLVSLLWLGGALFLLGTLISAWPERARLAAPRPLPATPAPPVPVEA